MKCSFRQLEVFAATARNHNISRAADELAMSQSAASNALKELETQFQVLLFDRVGKRLVLSELGRRVLPEAQAILERAQAFERVLQQDGSDQALPGGDLRVGATLSIGNYLVAGLVARYVEENPGARVALEVANTRQIVERISQFQLDIGLIEGELFHPDLVSEPWRDDELIIFCAPDHPYAKRHHLHDRELLEATWLLREEGSGTRQTFDRAMTGLLPRLNVLMELQHTEAIKRGVESGLGIGCLSAITLQDAFKRGSLVRLEAPGRDFRRTLYRVRHRRKFIGAGLQRWIAICDESIGG